MRLHESVRRRLQFRLRTLLIAMTLSAIPFSWIGWETEKARREQAAAAWVRGMGGAVDHEIEGLLWDGYQPDWWRRCRNKWLGMEVRQVEFLATEVTDLSRIAGLHNLDWLCLDNSQVSDLSPLTGLKRLTMLSLDNTQVSDLSPLRDLKKLRLLSLINTQVSDLSPLAELRNLKTLLLSDTQVSDLSSLSQLISLDTLSLDNTEASQ